MTTPLVTSSLPGLPLAGRGKVRDIYDLDDRLLIVATDRISAFDVVMPNPIPGKGRVLTLMSTFWFGTMADIIGNHVISTDPADYPEACRPYREVLAGRSMLVKKARPLPVECIVRGYLSGSGWKDYRRNGTVSGIRLPAGLKESSRLPEPIFTPSTKAPEGEHDLAITKEETERLIGGELTTRVIAASIAIYNRAAALAVDRGIIIADTKMEFGIYDGELIIIDELLTPDSSRFWPRDGYAEGRGQSSFDKQFLRDYLLSIPWDQRPPAPELPGDIISKTAEKYEEALKRLTS
ncbi:MAG TPA: phosphoribosylaminoimidazolesuccinocarboxamide synthase [Syntrophales bacterium]|nr:phosphoribosylaminoimidazolesuccinocarboxamide synthase [Syntrophales bacterium]HOH73592.1 phosphoribosylaminoimidazolesuccinocarboxamide synthase [Syntrophales bacterium]HPN09227.1 phosphoribosylaminoimidazolesuccinocarboxamide synthase [Syntrophales bacterium]HPX82502.1 phosphoribosylaminoimidazolesuccinocarboxamide synthase [Syntrophales bacterium]HQB13118.1 phosphoribosylaminoimidazolesuccinocarboxamide synthase [Syntrophales bacterium]